MQNFLIFIQKTVVYNKQNTCCKIGTKDVIKQLLNIPLNGSTYNDNLILCKLYLKFHSKRIDIIYTRNCDYCL